MLAHRATPKAKQPPKSLQATSHPLMHVRFHQLLILTEIAWMGKTEEQCTAEGIEITKGAFPWAASGRSLSNGRNEGMTKVLFDKGTGQLIGAGIVGTNAGELIAEAVLAL